jgi:hypothetical protein
MAILIGIGDDAEGDPFDNAQNPGSLLGKLLRIDVEPYDRRRFTINLHAAHRDERRSESYLSITDNPFVGQRDTAQKYGR